MGVRIVLSGLLCRPFGSDRAAARGQRDRCLVDHLSNHLRRSGTHCARGFAGPRKRQLPSTLDSEAGIGLVGGGGLQRSRRHRREAVTVPIRNLGVAGCHCHFGVRIRRRYAGALPLTLRVTGSGTGGRALRRGLRRRRIRPDRAVTLAIEELFAGRGADPGEGGDHDEQKPPKTAITAATADNRTFI